MNICKSVGIIGLALLIFALPGFAQSKFQAGARFILGYPQGVFNDFVDQTELGGAGYITYNIPHTPLSAGISLNALVYGHESRVEPFSSTIPDVIVDVSTTNLIIMSHLMFRLQAPEGRLRPYADALIGFSHLRTDTRVKCQESFETDTIARTTQISDTVFSYGAGAGCLIEVYSTYPRKDSGNFSIYVDLGARYLKGGEAEYLTEGSIYVYDDYVEHVVSVSRTDLLAFQIGVALIF